MVKYSRQREAILETLRSVKCHPSASWIYDHVRLRIPNISLGTVYRNLAELRERGEISSFTPADGIERFDGDITPHHHFYCMECHAVHDVFLPASLGLNQMAEEVSGFQISCHQLVFYGLCGDCKE